ncbi:CAP domain-containing protein [Paenibacillus marinisediminis]
MITIIQKHSTSWLTLRSLRSLCLLLIASTVMLAFNSPVEAKQGDFTDVPTSHWAYSTIMWSKDNGISGGYPDGTFRPSQHVTEAEWLAMVYRAYPEIVIPDSKPGEPWYTVYYAQAVQMGLPYDGRADLQITRGYVAESLAAVAGKRLPKDEAIKYIMDLGIAQGKDLDGVDSFAPNDKLSRAEAQTFLYRMKQVLPTLSSSLPDVIPSEDNKASISLHGIKIGDPVEKVVNKLGEPVRKDMSEHQMVWYIYNRDYSKYTQIGIVDGVVASMFSNGSGWSVGSKAGLTGLETEADKLWGKPYTSTDQMKEFKKDKLHIVVFLDAIGGGRADGLLVESEDQYRDAYVDHRQSSAELLQAYEQQIFDLANAFRVREGLAPFTWNETAAKAARQHSADMSKRNYFDHTNPDGKTPIDRLKANGAGAYRLWGENIAAGQSNAIYAHYSWVNSLGHRKNILHSGATTLGVGIARGATTSDYDIYYTQNFFTPR